MLTQPDFRSAERSFQLICQVAGRAGRRHSQSRVLVQTRTPLHPVLLQVQANDYEAMYAQQIGDRQKFGYPPFVRLIRVTLKHRDLNLLHSAAAALEQALRTEFGRQMLGPETPLVNRVRGLHMLNFWLKIPAATPIAQAKTLLRERLLNLRAQERFRSVAAVIDVDAY